MFKFEKAGKSLTAIRTSSDKNGIRVFKSVSKLILYKRKKQIINMI